MPQYGGQSFEVRDEDNQGRVPQWEPGTPGMTTYPIPYGTTVVIQYDSAFDVETLRVRARVQSADTVLDLAALRGAEERTLSNYPASGYPDFEDVMLFQAQAAVWPGRRSSDITFVDLTFARQPTEA